MISVWHQHDVAGAHLLEHFDRTVRRPVDPVVSEPARPVGATGDLEVVDLLEFRLGGRVLVVLVGGIARPVTAGRDDLTGDQRVGLENPCGAEVVHLAAAVAGAAQFDRNVGGGDAAVRERVLGAGAADREPALARDDVRLVDADVDHVGRAVEHRRPRRQFECLAVAFDGAAAGQRQNHHLGAGRGQFGPPGCRRVRLPAARIRSIRRIPA